MPPKRINKDRQTRNARAIANRRKNESETARAQRNEEIRNRMSRSRSPHRTQNTESGSIRQPENDSHQRHRRNTIQLNRAAFQYDANIDYSSHTAIPIGEMNKICQYCHAYRFVNETPGLCCANGKVKLPPLNPPPEPLMSLVSGNAQQSNHFLRNIQSYNSCFQMTSFGASNIIRDNFMPTFKVISPLGMSSIDARTIDYIEFFDIFSFSEPTYDFTVCSLQIQGQVYHKAGSLLPLPDANYKFLQIYFIGDSNDEVNHRCTIASNVKREIVEQMQTMMHAHNELVQLFTTALDRMPSDNHKIVIRADKTPIGEQARRFNAPTIDDVAIVIVGEEFQSRDIVLHRRNNVLKRVSETHRSYDALQYPILFCHGEDGYHLNIKMVNPANG